MKRTNRKLSALVALCALVAPADGSIMSLQAQRPRAQSSIVSNGQVAGAIAGIAGAGALIGILAYVAIRHNHSVTGCARSGPDGMTLTTEPDKQSYTLMGDVARIKAGERVRVSGKKGKDKSSATPKFLVEKVSRDFGPCEVAAAAGAGA